MPDQTELDSEPIELRPQSRSITARRSLGFAGANAQIANKLRQAADILATQGAHSFRTAAYRKAAESVLSLDTDLCTIAERGGRKVLEAIPGVGVSIAGAIAEMLTTGRWTFLLKGTVSPESLFRSVPAPYSPAEFTRRCTSIRSKGWRRRLMTGDWSRSAVSAIAVLQWCEPALPRCSRECAAAFLPIIRNPQSICCWMSIENTEKRRMPGSWLKLPQSASTRKERLGYLCSTPCAATGISLRSTRTPRGRTSLAGRPTGSSSFSTRTTKLKASVPW